MQLRSLTVSLSLIVATPSTGLILRLVHLGLPSFVVKYGGSVLWALMLYWIATSVLATWRLVPVAVLTGLLATSIEFFKLYHAPGLDIFRQTLPGTLLLGRFFSGRDIAAY